MKIRKHTIVIRYIYAIPDDAGSGSRTDSPPIDIFATLEDAQEVARVLSSFKNVIITLLYTPDKKKYVFESGKLRDEPHWAFTLTERQIMEILSALSFTEIEGMQGDPDSANLVYKMLSPFVEEQQNQEER